VDGKTEIGENRKSRTRKYKILGRGWTKVWKHEILKSAPEKGDEVGARIERH
jgi:hypothetical protein